MNEIEAVTELTSEQIVRLAGLVNPEIELSSFSRLLDRGDLSHLARPILDGREITEGGIRGAAADHAFCLKAECYCIAPLKRKAFFVGDVKLKEAPISSGSKLSKVIDYGIEQVKMFKTYEGSQAYESAYNKLIGWREVDCE